MYQDTTLKSKNRWCSRAYFHVPLQGGPTTGGPRVTTTSAFFAENARDGNDQTERGQKKTTTTTNGSGAFSVRGKLENATRGLTDT